LLGLAAEGYLEKVERASTAPRRSQEVPQAEFIKALARASKTDSTRQRDLSEISRLKQNNDVMRAKLLGALAERDHYLAALKQHGIDPGPLPAPIALPAAAVVAPGGCTLGCRRRQRRSGGGFVGSGPVLRPRPRTGCPVRLRFSIRASRKKRLGSRLGRSRDRACGRGSLRQR
jgi:hypothetical protein